MQQSHPLASIWRTSRRPQPRRSVPYGFAACHGHLGHARARAGCPWHGPRVTHFPTSVIGFSGTDHEGGDDGALRGGVASTVEKERGSAHGRAQPLPTATRESGGERAFESVHPIWGTAASVPTRTRGCDNGSPDLPKPGYGASRSNAARSHPPRSAAASYVDCRNSRSVRSGDSAHRTLS